MPQKRAWTASNRCCKPNETSTIAPSTKKVGGRTHAALAAALDVLVDPLPVDLIPQLVVETLQIELQRLGVAAQILLLQMELVLEQGVVHRPELVLGTGRFRGFRGELRVRMDFGERKVPEREADAMLEMLQQLLHRRIGLPAGGAFEVAVLDDDDARRLGADDMVAPVERNCESEAFRVGVHLRCAEVGRSRFSA